MICSFADIKKVEHCIRWEEHVLGSVTSRSMMKVYIEEFLDDIPKVQVQNGWEHHFLEEQMLNREMENTHLSWNCVFVKSVKYVLPLECFTR